MKVIDSNGFLAYEIKLALDLHYNPKVEYNAWDYNFKTRASLESFEKNRREKFQYAKIERDYPSKEDLIRFYWPSYALDAPRKRTFKSMRSSYTEYMLSLESIVDDLRAPCEALAEYVESPTKLLDYNNDLPLLYEFIINNDINYILTLWLCTFLPIETIEPRETIIFPQWKHRILKDLPFFELYIQGDFKKELTLITFNYFSNAFKNI